MVLHPNFKKLLFFCTILIALASIYKLLEVDISYIEETNKAFYYKIDSLKTTFNYHKKKPAILKESKKISLNKAYKNELMKLPFIGDKTADKIIEYRNKTKFNSINDIMKIKGIGKKRFLKIKNHLTL